MQIANSVIDPLDVKKVANKSMILPQPKNWPEQKDAFCNSYVPDDSTFMRFAWVVQVRVKEFFLAC